VTPAARSSAAAVRRAARAAAVTAALTAALAACPLPIPYTERTSPPVTGVVERSDGTRVAGAPVAVVGGGGSSHACGRALIATTTNAAGAFTLPPTERRHRVFWAVPGLDVAAPSYVLCVGTSDSLLPAYSGYFAFGASLTSLPRDSLACVEWEWKGRPRVACDHRRAEHPAVIDGGRWRDANGASGRFRLIVSGGDRLGGERHVFVQWLEVPSADSTARVVRSTIDLAEAIGIYRIDDPHLREWRGQSEVAVLGADEPSRSPVRRYYARLGAPGEVTRREVAACGGAADRSRCPPP
jgi:hypothetical protein